MPPAPAQALGNQSDPNTFLQLPPIKLSPDASESDSDLCPTPSTSRPKPRPANVKTKKALLDKGKEKDVGQKADKRGGRSAGTRNFSNDETDYLLSCVREHLPIGPRGWDDAAASYNRWADENGTLRRTIESVRTKFLTVSFSVHIYDNVINT